MDLQFFSLKNGLPYGAIPFDRIQHKDFNDVIKRGIAQAKETIEKIKTQPAAPDFKNTIEALEFASLPLERASGVYFNLQHACTSAEIDAQSDTIAALLAEYGNDIQLDAALFTKIKDVYDKREQLHLNTEQAMLLKKYYEDFARNGALLNEQQKEQLREIDKELAQITPRFGQNLLKATNAFALKINDPNDLAGLPETARKAAQEAALEKGDQQSWHFSLQAPSYIPFMTYAQNRELRRQMWLASNQRSFQGEFDNSELCERIAELRAQRAQLLGYKTHADFVLSRRMAKSTATVKNFLEKLLPPSLAATKKEIEDIRALRQKLEGETEIMPWDFAYYSEKLKEQLFQFSEEDLRPYFQLEKTLDGIFLHAQKLFGLQFKITQQIPTYHPDVKVYEVLDDKGFVGLLYFDVFPRANKRGGAWMTSFLEQGSDGVTPYRPHVSIVCNFSKPTKESPSLLTFAEVQTLFHEFGHALHSLLSSCTYPSLAGTNVLWDFVELPSQIMENWALEKQTIDLFAKHHQTNAPLPETLFLQLKKSKNFNAGYASLRQVSFCYIDLAWHDVTPGTKLKTAELEDKVLGPLAALPRIPGTNFSVTFSHIFAGGYSAGYYSYKWAEVLDADAFEYFLEKGIYNREVAQKFRDCILSRGGTAEPDQLYREFRGREPDPKALLRRSGLLA
jgi:peptidyl-dipeptidase Dcp